MNVPSCESGVQKVTSVLFDVASCGEGYMAAELLGVDEVFFPIQKLYSKNACKGPKQKDDKNTLANIVELDYAFKSYKYSKVKIIFINLVQEC